MCEYCNGLWNLTPEERMVKRIERFVEECREKPLGKYRRDGIADALESFLNCERWAQERYEDARRDAEEIRMDGVAG